MVENAARGISVNADRRCPLCATPGRTSFLRLEAVPVNQNLLMTTYEAARGCERGDLDIAFCDTCGFIANLAFDPARLRYTPDYENAQSFSPSFRRYLADVASQLVSRHDIRGKRVVEIGCAGMRRVVISLDGRARGLEIRSRTTRFDFHNFCIAVAPLTLHQLCPLLSGQVDHRVGTTERRVLDRLRR